MASTPHSPEPRGANSPSTAMTTPEGTTLDSNDDDDIWESDGLPDDHLSLPPRTTSASEPSEQQPHQRRVAPLLSDLPTVKRQHMTDGYREGLAVGKAQVMQRGFDAGYPTGMAVAVRVGRILGVLEGCLAAKGSGEAERREWQRTLDRAGRELACASLLAGLTDEVVDQVEPGCIPDGVEIVIERWERLVLGTPGPAT